MSDQFQTLKQQLDSLKDSPDPAKRIQYDSVFATSSHVQQTLMSRRIFHIMKRAPSYNLTRLMIAILYSLILGTTFIRSRHKGNVFDQNDMDGIFSVVFLALIIVGVVSVSMAVPVMKQIRDVFYKHRASGMLGHNSVTMAVTIGELPYIGLMSAIFSIIFYSLVGLFGTANRWFFFFLIFGLNIATYTYFGQAFMCLVRDTTTAGALVGALIGFNVFFSGLVVRPQYFVGPFLVGFWTAPGRFAYEAIIVTQFKGE
jgi:ABC-type multidrug transport system permease subunit